MNGMFQSLPGFREFYPEDCAVRNALFAEWREACTRFAFQEFDGPALEPLELFTAKSGPEIVSQLFNFPDKGGREVSLRPEMTPTLARLVGAKAGSLKRPIRWFSIGENFRYEKPQKGRLRSFYQLNADILGEPDPAADAEIIALLVHLLCSFGLGQGDFIIRLSDRTLWLLLLEAKGVPETLYPEALSAIDKLEREDPPVLVSKLTQAGISDAQALYDSARELATVHTLAGLKAFCASAGFADQSKVRLADWETLLSQLEAQGIGDFIKVDLSIVRGLAYYTGFVFEAFQTVGKGRALAGGGRYDNLVEKLGGQPMPAVGFGMGDVTLRDLLELKGLVPEVKNSPDAYLIIGGPEQRPFALRVAANLRAAGIRVSYGLKEASFGKQFKAADQCSARYAVVIGSDEAAAEGAKLKDLASGDEQFYPISQLASAVKYVNFK